MTPEDISSISTALAHYRAQAVADRLLSVHLPLLVLAPPCAGKTTLASSAPETFLDGDRIIRERQLWPPQHRWWESMSNYDKDQLAHRHLIALWAEGLTSRTGRSILFNTRPDVAATVWPGSIIVWVPDEDAHRRNVTARAADQARRGSRSQPDTWAEVSGARDRLSRAAVLYRWPVVSHLS